MPNMFFIDQLLGEHLIRGRITLYNWVYAANIIGDIGL